MANEEIRKKWGTIFMGDNKEATLEELDAMQEPIRREKLKKIQQENYLESVRIKATEKAKAILGEAYTERQKILAEAREEGEADRSRLIKEGEALQAKAREAYDEAAKELDKAKAIREEADDIKSKAHEEGFNLGMQQAGQELKEFRADIGQSFAKILRSIDLQKEIIIASWCEDLAELMRVAISSGTGYILQKEHVNILNALVLKALNQLEDRTNISARVNPEDEKQVSDLFLAAREKVPELKQWVINGDSNIESGGLVVENSSGSVDCRREYFKEMVDGILSHLAVIPREELAAQFGDIHAISEREIARIIALAPPVEDEVIEQTQDDSINADQVVESDNSLLNNEQADLQVDSAEHEESLINNENKVDQGQVDIDSVENSEDIKLIEEMADAVAGNSENNASLTEEIVEDESILDDKIIEDKENIELKENSIKDDVGEGENWIPPLENAEINDGVDPDVRELEEELFPVEESSANDAILAGGGFLAGKDNET